jgi:hypothetical protein
LLGNCLLPHGDFATIAQLPAMYQHCKVTEDPDINIPDFIVEHLLNLEDVAAEQGDKEEHELPHNPVPFHTVTASVFYYTPVPILLSFAIENPVLKISPQYQSPYYPCTGVHDIFQPPRA